MNRNARVFTPRTIESAAKSKAKEISNNVLMPTPNIESQKVPLSYKDVENQKEGEEFLRMIKKSDYKVVDKLKHTPSKISMMSLLLSYEAHRVSLMKVLSVANIIKYIILDQFDEVIENVTAGNFLGFNDKELTLKGKITTKTFISL